MQGYQFFSIVCFIFLAAFIGCSKSSSPSGSGGSGQNNSASFHALKLTTPSIVTRSLTLRSGNIDSDEFLDIIGIDQNRTLFMLSDGKGFFKQTIEVNGFGFQNIFSYNAAFDFDSDGDDDWVSRTGNSSALSIFRNNGRGGFTFQDSVLMPSVFIQLFDIDSDSDSDFVFLQPSVDSVTFVYNTDAGSYVTRKASFLGDSLGARFICADIDGDLKRDIAVTKHNTDSMRVYKNQGNESFTLLTGIALDGAIPDILMATDMDDNTSVDLVIVDNITLYLLRNDGAGQFSKEQVYQFGIGIPDIALRDIDLDTDMDVIFYSMFPSRGSMGVLRNNGSGQFIDTVIFGENISPSDMAIADVNNDQLVDVGGSFEFLSAGVFMNKGNGDFFVPPQIEMGIDQSEVALADVNKDGTLDIVAAGDNAWGIAVTAQTDSGFQAPIIRAVASEPIALSVGDFDENGYPDIATCGISGPITIRFNGNNASFDTSVNKDGAGGRVLLQGDFDGNSHIDLLAAGVGGVFLLPNLGSGQFDAPISQLLAINAWFGHVSDFDKDGDLDVALAEMSDNTTATPKWLYILKNNGNALFSHIDTLQAGGEPIGMTGGDFDGDGDDDILLGGKKIIWVYINQAGDLQPAVTYSTPAALLYPIGRDIDDDNDVDVVGVSPYNHSLTILFNDGTGALFYGGLFGFVTEATTLDGGDIDTDGDIDIIVGGGEAQPVTIFYNMLK